MIEIPGYEVIEACAASAGLVTYTGVHRESRAPVLLRAPDSANPSAGSVAKLRRDYQISRSLADLDVIAHPRELISCAIGEVLVIDDDGSRPLKSVVGSGAADLGTFLSIATGLASAVDQLHLRQVIHKNLNDESVWLHPDTGAVILADFSIASRTPHESDRFVAKIEGWLPYIAPEQTGRMNRSIDHRVDHYSMGVILYRLITGRLPFDTNDPFELIYCHLAREPRPPDALNPEIPTVISAILLKLLSKAPEDRYQRAGALRSDLDRCADQWRSGRQIESFSLGAHDSLEVFRIPESVYGRDDEVSILLSAYERAAKGSREFVVVTGEPGIGKSALVGEIHKPISRGRGTFISGKFDQYKRAVPYSAIIQAFGSLVTGLLSESAEQVANWRDRFLKALNGNGQVVIDVIPEIELVIGPQPTVPGLPPSEDRNRFVRVFCQFINVFAHKDRPLAIFLDDLQWADSASLSIVRALMVDPETDYVLLIGAYRDGEVGSTHPLVLTLEEMADVVAPQHIPLGALAVEYVTQLLADTFHCEPATVRPLAELVHQKTDGNPFFLNQFLQFLLSERLIEVDPEAGSWHWDLGRIQERGLTDNVVQLMSRRIRGLSAPTVDTLRTAACIGNPFDLRTLSLVMERPISEIRACIREALRAGVLVVPADAYQVADEADSRGDGPGGENAEIRFLHDRVQQAAYAFISASDRERLHLRTGRLLRASMTEQELVESPFDVVNHLNAGAALITDSVEKRELARLNLVAGQKARRSTAFRDAIGFLRTGISQLGNGGWKSDYQLMFDLHAERLECEYQAGNPEEAERVFDVVLAASRTKLEKAQIYYAKILVATNRNQTEEAIRAGLEALKLFDIRIPEHPSRSRILAEIVAVKVRLRGRSADSLMDRRRLTDPETHAAMRLLMSICPAAYFSNPDLMSLAALRIVNMTLRHGNAPASSYGYVLYALISGAVLGDYATGQAFGRLAERMSAVDDDILLRCKVLFIFMGLVNHWRAPIESSIEGLRDSYKTALDAGDIQYGTYSLQFVIQLMLFQGRNLREVYEECLRHEPFTHNTRDVITTNTLRYRKNFVKTLQGRADPKSDSTSSRFDEAQFADSVRRSGNATGIAYYLIPKLQLAYLFDDYETAVEVGVESEANLRGVLSQVLETEHHLYRGLTAAALIRRGTGARRRRLRILRRATRKLAKWAVNQPENFSQQARLLKAELAAVRNRDAEAVAEYDNAMEAARSHGAQHIEALANVLAARHHQRHGRERISESQFREARRLYAEWGAFALVQRLEEECEFLREKSAEAAFDGLHADSSARAAGNLLDLDAVIRANQAIASEVDMDRLLAKLMAIALETAGAERGGLVLDNQGELEIVAVGSSTSGDVVELKSQPLERSEDVFVPVVNYVARARTDLVLDDARSDPRFSSMPYVLERDLKSVLCSPVIKQGKLVGILYLENNLLTHAFSPERLQSLRLICSEIASAVENARLVGELKENNEALQRALNKVELLEKAKTHLAKFVPQSVRRIIDEDPVHPQLEKQERDVSLLFLDIAGYTHLSENLDQAKVNYLVERYFSSFLDDIHNNGGDINETVGDGLMIFFQGSEPGDHAIRAARTAISIQERTQKINEDLSGEYDPVLINIGINSGVAAVGSTRLEGVTGTRYTFTASGTVTNLAARLGAHAEGGAILVSKATADRIAYEFVLEDLGVQHFRHVAEPSRVFRLRGKRSEAAMNRMNPVGESS